MESTVKKVGMREFRAHLPGYLMNSSPVAITRHGETIGFYIPAHTHPKHAELSALKKVTQQLENLLASYQLDENTLISDFKTLRKKGKQ